MEKAKTNFKADTFCEMFRFQEGIYRNAVEGLNEQIALERVLEKTNHTNWLLGHILHCRFMLAGILGVKEENPFGKTYWGKLDDRKFPSIKEVSTHFPLISDKLRQKLLDLSDEELNVRPAEGKPSLSEIISFFIYHEAYHIGQLGLTRKLIGLETLKSN